MIEWNNCRILVTGGAGFLGRNIVARLRARGTPEPHLLVGRSAEHDLTNQADVLRLLSSHVSGQPLTMVIHSAGLVGGLGANKARPADFFHNNMAMVLNLVESLAKTGFSERGGKFVMVGSMTSYPADAPVPFKEDDLFKGYPDAASAPYAIAKLAALEMLRAYRTQYGLRSAYVIPVNLYGPGDNLDPGSSHFVGALVDRCVRATRAGAPVLECWGTGRPTREFLFVEDAAEGVVRAAEEMDEPTPINLGSGAEHSIREMVDLIVKLCGYQGEVRWDPTKPDGVGRRSMDVSRAGALLGWRAKVGIEEGLARTVRWRESLRD